MEDKQQVDIVFHSIQEAIDDLLLGKPIIVVDDENRENEGDFIALAEKATPDLINFMITYGRGLVCVPITHHRAKELNLTSMVEQNTDFFGTAFTISIDSSTCHTGISTYDRSRTVKEMINSKAREHDFRKPGHIFPLIAKPGGVLTRPGHTEAAVDLARLCGSFPAGVICEVLNEDGTMARVPELLKIAKLHDLKIITIADLIRFRMQREKLIHKIAEVRLPTDYGEFQLIAYVNDVDGKEHLALVKGKIDPNFPILVRVHSECLTGDIFASRRCDCGQQLSNALVKIEKEGIGVLLYMRQEGRGIGLINKLRSYELQEYGYDTVEANEKLGFPADPRDYGIAAQILRDLGVRNIRLLTNNPRKITGLQEYGLNIVKREPIQGMITKDNDHYLMTKKFKLGHLLNLNEKADLRKESI